MEKTPPACDAAPTSVVLFETTRKELMQPRLFRHISRLSQTLEPRTFALLFSLGGAAVCTGCPTSGGAVGLMCGDGVLDADLAESCDDGNAVDGDGCSATCEIEAGFECAGEGDICYTVCGDGILSAAEECDDGIANGGATCNADCTLAAHCGDGVVALGEECDDGNAESGDGCAVSCQVEEGFVCVAPGGPCGVTLCGDGVIAGTEMCDEGANNGPGYGECNYDCTWGPFCGDGIVQASEVCDDGASNGADSACYFDCTWNTP